MRFDSSQWYPHNSPDPKPVQVILEVCWTRWSSMMHGFYFFNFCNWTHNVNNVPFKENTPSTLNETFSQCLKKSMLINSVTYFTVFVRTNYANDALNIISGKIVLVDVWDKRSSQTTATDNLVQGRQESEKFKAFLHHSKFYGPSNLQLLFMQNAHR